MNNVLITELKFKGMKLGEIWIMCDISFIG